MTRSRIIGIMFALFLLFLFVKGAEDDSSPNGTQEEAPATVEKSPIDAPATEDAKVERPEPKPEPKPEPNPKPKVAEEPTRAQRPGVVKSKELTRRAQALLVDIEPKMVSSFNGGGEKVLGCFSGGRTYLVTTDIEGTCIKDRTHGSSSEYTCLKNDRRRGQRLPENMGDGDLEVYNRKLSTFVSVLEACKGVH